MEATAVFGMENSVSDDTTTTTMLIDHIDGNGEGYDDSDSHSGGDGNGNNTRGGDGDGEITASAMQLSGVSAMQHMTRPPSRFTEASFIKELETIGVGRPSTYSKIFQILKEREYLHVDKQVINVMRCNVMM